MMQKFICSLLSIIVSLFNIIKKLIVIPYRVIANYMTLKPVETSTLLTYNSSP